MFGRYSGYGIYNDSLFPYPSAEGIFLNCKSCSFDIEIYFPRTLIFQIKGKEESILHWSNCKGAINSTSAVNWAQILLPRMVLSISFWEQCSRAPPLFPPLLLKWVFSWAGRFYRPLWHTGNERPMGNGVKQLTTIA